MKKIKIGIILFSLFALTFLGSNAKAENNKVFKGKIEAIKRSLPIRSSIDELRLVLSAQGAKKVAQGDSVFVEIQDAVDFASKKTGVRKDFLMGMLVVESNLGRNVGKCTYTEIEKDAEDAHRKGRLSESSWGTFLRRKEIMNKISTQLGYNPNEIIVSCNPAEYIGTGGAMGVAQFMPDTWIEYEKRIAEVVEVEKPNPWNVRHGVVAMALKLSDVSGVISHAQTAEENAAKIYLSGTTSGRYNWYARKIIYWANNYHKLIV